MRATAGTPAGHAGTIALAAVLVTLLVALLSAIPADARQERQPPRLDAASWILLDARDGDRLAARGPARTRPIASATKLMTAYLALAELPFDRRLSVPDYAAAPAESVAGLIAGERLTVRDLVVAMMLPSANDAAQTIALGVSPSVPQFVEEMNRAAADLGLERTSYANPIGLDDPLNFSTAADLAALTLELRSDPRFRKIVALPEATLESGSTEREVFSRNALLLSDPSVDGVKTGHTLGAGYVLVGSAKREGVPLVSVVLGAPSEAARDQASAELLDYGYSLYDERRAFASGERLAAAAIRYRDEPLELVAAKDLPVQARADQELATSVEAPTVIEGPIDRGERLGSVEVSLDGEPVGTVPLLAASAVAAPTFVERIGGPVVLAAIIIAAIVILLAVALLLRRGADRAGARARSSEDRVRSRHERRSRRSGGAR